MKSALDYQAYMEVECYKCRKYGECQSETINECMEKGEETFKCQFCGYESKNWRNKGQACPECGKEYSWVLAQDSEG